VISSSRGMDGFDDIRMGVSFEEGNSVSSGRKNYIPKIGQGHKSALIYFMTNDTCQAKE